MLVELYLVVFSYQCDLLKKEFVLTCLLLLTFRTISFWHQPKYRKYYMSTMNRRQTVEISTFFEFCDTSAKNNNFLFGIYPHTSVDYLLREVEYLIEHLDAKGLRFRLGCWRTAAVAANS